MPTKEGMAVNSPEDGPIFRWWPDLPQRRPLLAATYTAVIWGGVMALILGAGGLIFLTEGLGVYLLFLIIDGGVCILGGAVFGLLLHRTWTGRPMPGVVTRPGLPFLGSRGDD